MKTLRNLIAATFSIIILLTSCDQNPIDPTDIIDKEINPEIPAKPKTDPGTGCKWRWDAFDWEWEKECDENPENPETPGKSDGNDSGPEYSNDLQGAIQKSLAIFDGQVTETETDQDWGQNIYKVEITSRAGDVVDFKWKAAGGKLYKIQSDSEPVTYDLDPGNGLITLGEAIKIARQTSGKNRVVEFELDREAYWGKFYGNQWVYAIAFEEYDDEYKVILDATSGKVLDQFYGN